ncbi:MAG: 16S rRNA (guanine(966)-N(2))-methyltransferase RsmD [Bacillota bacterium]
MRIVGGERRGYQLKAPRGRKTRPTSDMVREALFSILSPVVQGSVFYDVFAGSGAVGIEALSRGAERVVFVEESPASCRIINMNLKNTGYLKRSLVLQKDVFALGSLRELPRADIVFMDPPYDSDLAARILLALPGIDALGDAGVVVVEHSRRIPSPDIAGPFVLRRRKYYGDTALAIYYRQEE